MSSLIIHNGHRKTKDQLFLFATGDFAPSLADEWPGCKSIVERINYAKHNNLNTDITVADREQLSADIWVDIVKNFNIVKIVTNYSDDTDDLDCCWLPQENIWINDYNRIKDSTWPECRTLDDWYNLPSHVQTECLVQFGIKPATTPNRSVNYNQNFWQESLFFGLGLCNKFIYRDQIQFPCNDMHQESIVFSPGRSGTHVLMCITGIESCVHNQAGPANDSNWKRLTESRKIFAVMRRQFFRQVASEAVSRKYAIILTTEDTIQYNQELVSSWQPFCVTNEDIQDTFNKMLNFADRLWGLHRFYNKKIIFNVMEDLHNHFEKIRYKKNPYDVQKLIVNYNEMVTTCNDLYQPVYDQLIDRLVKNFGNS
jgi:hypothetical protein